MVCLSLRVVSWFVCVSQQQDGALQEIERASVVGWLPEWQRLGLSDSAREYLSTTPRIERDTLARILTTTRYAARVQFFRDLEDDFWTVFDRTGKGTSWPHLWVSL
jgi:hypothetical protein